jgi:hypothetical protein
MRRTLLEDIERMNQISRYIIPKTIERDYDDMDDMRNHPPKKLKYRGVTFEKDWLGLYSFDGYMTNKLGNMYDFIDKKIEENPDLVDSDED